MKTIHKFTLAITSEQTIKIPGYVELLSVAEQKDEIVVYAIVEAPPIENQHKLISFLILGTGSGFFSNERKNWRFLNTVSTRNGSLIWHVFVEED